MEALLIAALITCPAAVSQQLDGLYRWQIERRTRPRRGISAANASASPLSSISSCSRALP